MRVRAKNRWLLRVPNGTKTIGMTEPGKQAKGTKRKREDELPGDMQLENILNPIDQATLEQAANQARSIMSTGIEVLILSRCKTAWLWSLTMIKRWKIS